MAEVAAHPGQLSFASYLAPSLWPLYRAVGEYASRRIGRHVQLLTGSSFAQFASGEVDFGFM